MKYCFWVISAFIAAICIYLMIINFNNTTVITLANQNIAETLQIQPITLSVNLSILIFTIFALGESCFATFIFPALLKNKEKEGAYERRLEKTSVSNEESSAKVKVLENKIQVLEKALEDALKKKQ